MMTDAIQNHRLVLVSKLPNRGISKTRLYSSIGIDDAFELAVAMLLDLLTSFSSKVDGDSKSVLYVPFQYLVDAAGYIGKIQDTSSSWCVMPMPLQSNTESLKTISLTSVLSFGLSNLSQGMLHEGSSTTFIGSDTPHLPVIEWLRGRELAAKGEAYICPATDGGYVLLSLPANAPAQVFENITWSSSQTCTDQIRAIEAVGIKVTVGNSYTDIDDGDDIASFIRIEEYLISSQSSSASTIASSSDAVALSSAVEDRGIADDSQSVGDRGEDLSLADVSDTLLESHQRSAYASGCPRTREFFRKLITGACKTT